MGSEMCIRDSGEPVPVPLGRRFVETELAAEAVDLLLRRVGTRLGVLDGQWGSDVRDQQEGQDARSPQQRDGDEEAPEDEPEHRGVRESFQSR